MKTIRKIFIASSMTNPFRAEIPEVIRKVNNESGSIEYELLMYENTPFPVRNEDTQQELNKLAESCDIFVLLIEQDRTVGRFTMGEYKCALQAFHNSSTHTPFIVPYVVYNNDKSIQPIPYEEEVDGNVITGSSIEERISADFGGKKYLRFTPYDNTPSWGINGNNFLQTFERDLKETVKDAYHYYSHDELSYAHHISDTEHRNRNANTRYFVRENLDGKMANIVEKSSLLIIEGNSYSGKTRAVYELMKNNPQWSNADFYIYRCGHDTMIEDINDININHSQDDRHAVYFFDDFSNLLKKRPEDINKNKLGRFWNLICSITPNELPQWKNITIIITMSGELTYHEKQTCYNNMFGTEIYAHCVNTTLNDVIVNFDIYNRQSFNNMAAEMVRTGVIPKENVRPGNYTIGSLFVDTNQIKAQLKAACINADIGFVLECIKMQQMYTSSLRKGLYEDIKNLWCFIKKIDNDEVLITSLEYLCSKRWIVLDYDGSKIQRVNIDNYVLEAIDLEQTDMTVVGNQHNSSNRSLLTPQTQPRNFVNILIDYASSGMDSVVKLPERMAYILCDRMCLTTDEIKYLIEKLGGAHQGTNKDINNLFNICNRYRATLPDTKKEDQYANVFCQNAIVHLPCEELMVLLDKILAVLNDPKLPTIPRDVLTDLYIRIVYRMLSVKKYRVSSFFSNIEYKPLTMAQERALLALVFHSHDYRIDNMKAPFSADDLLDVFNLKYIAHVIRMTSFEIVDQAKKAAVNSASFYVQIESGIFGDEEVVDEEGINNVLLPQLGNLLIEAMLKTTSFGELMEIILILRNASEEHISTTIALPTFSNSFYNNIQRLVLRFTYEDRYELFKYLINLNDNHSVLDVENTSIDADINRFKRIRALNNILSLLDEKSAIEAYKEMVKSDNIDGYTLSMYMNNEFLLFEHLFDAVIKYGRGNYLTNNQLLYNAKTVSDAQMCLLNVMKVRDGDPARLKDEFALGAYLGIKDLSCSVAIDIIKRWKSLHIGKNLHERTIGALVSKLAKDSSVTIYEMALLFGIPVEKRSLPTAKELYNRWGLEAIDVNILRHNPQCWNQFFQKLNRSCRYDIMQCAFGLLIKNRIASVSANSAATVSYLITRDIVLDNSHKTYILSEYIKNVFTTYEDTRKFVDELRTTYPELRLTAFIFKSYLRKIVWETIGDGRKEVDDDVRRKGADRVNAVLVEAYNYFVNAYTSSEVVEQMSNLYSFRIQLIGREVYNYNKIMSFAYEDNIIEMTFAQYLDYIYNHETAYADGNFVFIALSTMHDKVDNLIYDKIKAIAKKNHRGINMEKKSNNSTMQLSRAVKHRLIAIGEDTITIDKDLVYNYSPIKMLIYLTQNLKISYDKMECYRKNLNIPITSAYLNHAFKVIAKDKSIANDDKFALMNNLINTHCSASSLYSKSIQMCVNMLEVCHNNTQLNEVVKIFYDDFHETSEYLGVWNKKYFDINFHDNADNALDSLRLNIINNRHLVNIHIVNGYLNALYRITAHIHYTMVNPLYFEILNQCWKYLDKTGNIDLNILLQLNEDDKWEITANQLSYIYFAHIVQPNIVLYIARRFNNNFYFENKKSCLGDCLKNFADHQHKIYPVLNEIVDILIQKDESGKYMYNNELNEIFKKHFQYYGNLSKLYMKLKLGLTACGVVKKS